MEQLYTVESAAEALLCSKITISRHIAAGRLSAIDISTGSIRADYRIRQSALDEFLAQTSTKPRYSGLKRQPKIKNHFPEFSDS